MKVSPTVHENLMYLSFKQKEKTAISHKKSHGQGRDG
jgi:hypothetical protein